MTDNKDSELNIDTQELIQLVKIQQEELKRKNKELEEMHEIYSVFKQESEELESVLSKQVDLFEDQLKNYESKEKQNLEKYADQLAEQKLQSQETIKEYDVKLDELKNENFILKKLLIDNGIEITLEQFKKTLQNNDQEQNQEVSQKNVQRLNLELGEKKKVIDELTQDIEKVKGALKQQHSLFNDMKIVIENQKETYLKQIQDQEQKHQENSNNLKELVKQQDIQLTKYKSMDNEEKSSNSDEVQKLQNLVVVQGNKLKQISKDYIEYKQGAEKLLEYEKLIRDTEIEKQKVNIERQTLQCETWELKFQKEQQKQQQLELEQKMQELEKQKQKQN